LGGDIGIGLSISDGAAPSVLLPKLKLFIRMSGVNTRGLISYSLTLKRTLPSLTEKKLQPEPD